MRYQEVSSAACWFQVGSNQFSSLIDYSFGFSGVGALPGVWQGALAGTMAGTVLGASFQALELNELIYNPFANFSLF